MNVVSLFNGMGFCAMALQTLAINVNKFYSSEIDKYANQATQALFPDTIQVGDVTKWREWDINWKSIDLVTGGFPCQAWSLAGKQLGDKDERGMLFWVMLDIMQHARQHNPNVDFVIENVKMKKEFEEYITTHTENALGHVHKILINSALVSAQNRNRYYWTSFEVSQPADKGILLKDIIESGKVDRDKSLCVNTRVAGATEKRYKEKSMHQMVIESDYTIMTDTFINRQQGRKCLVSEPKDKAVSLCANEYLKNGRQGDYIQCDENGEQTVFKGSVELKSFNPDSTCHHIANATDIKGNQSIKRVYADSGKAPTLTTMQGGHQEPKVLTGEHYRKLTPRECFRLQTVPEHHINTLLNAGISNSQLYKMCGNGWTHDVIVHIFKNLPARNVNLELFELGF